MRVAVLVLCAGCRSIFGLDDPTRVTTGDAVDEDASGDDAASGDAAVDGQGSGVWGNVELAFSSTTADDDPTLTADMLLMYFDRGGDVWMTSRNSTADAWATPIKNDELSTLDTETTPELDAGGLFAMVSSNRSGSASTDVWWSLRASRSAAWPAMQLLPNVNSSSGDIPGPLTADTLTFVLASNRPSGAGGYDLYITTRQNIQNSTFNVPTRIVELSTAGQDYSPFITADGSELYWDDGGSLFHARRNAGGWDSPEPITELNTNAAESDIWVSPDGRHMYFARDARIYHATR
jgi:hypothetical protein